MAPRPLVFLSYNEEDLAAVKDIAEQIRGRCRPWLKDVEVPPGRIWKKEAEETIQTCKAAAIFVGESGFAPWEDLEMRTLLSQAVDREIPVFAVLLPGAAGKPAIPPFLREFVWVDLRTDKSDGIARMIWGITSKKPASKTPSPAIPVTPEDRVLDMVNKDWVQSFLDKKIPKARWIDLKMEQRPDKVGLPDAAWKKAVETAPTLLPEKALPKLFRDQRCSLLILGDSGSGKTTALLLLARSLIGARQSRNEPIPVYLHLSSWKGQPLGDWLVEAMGIYQAKDITKRSWLPESRILLLLDGLDEVQAECQADCVIAINDWLDARGIEFGMAVCCHKDAYEQMSLLNLRTAVVLRPLIEEQIDNYAAAAGSGAETLRAALAGDEGLRKLAETPELLHLIADDCEDKAGVLAGSTGVPLEERRRMLVGRDVDRKLEQGPLLYTQEHILAWLTWLAKGMNKHNMSLFQLEQLQPSWPSGPIERFAYFLASRMLTGMLLILPLALILGPSLILSGLIAGALIGIFDASWAALRRGAPTGPWEGLASALFAALATFPRVDSLFLASLTGLLFGLVLGLRSAERKDGRDIQTAEALRWSWGSWKGALTGAGAGGFIGVLSWIVLRLEGQSAPALQALQLTGLLLLAGAMIGTLLGGVKVGLIPKKASPNLGMRLTLERGAFLFLVVFLGISLPVGAVILALHQIWPETRLSLRPPLLLGSLFGFWTGLGFGGLDFLQHFVLRALLRLRGYAPFRYVEFLNHAADLRLLHRAGGSYFFYHQQLREYFGYLSECTLETENSLAPQGPRHVARGRSAAGAETPGKRPPQFPPSPGGA